MSDNYITETGLHLQTRQEIIDKMTTELQAIYGADINLEANSPDGQMLQMFAQAKIDLLECIAQVYNSFSPETAVGVALDMRCAINGVIRAGATHTITNVTVTTDRTVTLSGLDTAPTTPYTVADEAGTKFFLEETVTLSAGATVLSFRAENAGLVETTIGTITTPVTIVLGVLTVNNPNSATTQGTDEETDPQLRLRRQQSVSLPSQGWIDAQRAALLAVDDVTDASVYENLSDTTDVYGVPGHSMWAIVDGGTDADIAEAIYRKRNAGCGMFGAEEVEIIKADGNPFTIFFDRPIDETLYINLTMRSINVEHTIDDVYLQEQIFAQIVYGIFDPADISQVVALVKSLDTLSVVTDAEVSRDNSNWDSYIYPATVQNRFLLSMDRIVITVL